MQLLASSHLTSSAWGALAAWFTALIYIGLGVFAFYQLREMRRSREAQTRPFVIVDVPPGWLMHLVVRNIGSTAARDVTFKFTPELASTVGRFEAADSPLLRDGAPMLPPGTEYRIFLDATTQRLNADLPMRYEVEITYSGPGPRRRQGPFVDRYVLDLNLMRNTSPPQSGGFPEVIKGLEKIKAGVDNVASELRGLRGNRR